MIASAGSSHPVWFTRLGQPASAVERDHALGYVAALGLHGIALVLVTDWREAQAIASDPHWDLRWWEREESERERLRAACLARLGRDETLARLSAATEVAQAIHDAALDAAGRDGFCSEELPRAASGAGAMALHDMALAQLAGEGSEHPFMRKYALFACGRWPLAVVADRFHLF